MSLGKNLKRLTEQHGYNATRQQFVESLSRPEINRLVSIRDIAEGFMGPRWYHKLQLYNSPQASRLMEASDAVDASQFVDITGQLLVNEIRAKYDSPEFVGDKLVETEPIANGNLGPQREPRLSKISSGPKTVQPGMPYPQAQFQEEYFDLPQPRKFGHICSVTMEAVDSDLTRQIRESAQSVGERVRVEKEEDILSCVMGLDRSSTSRGYNFNNHSYNGTTYNTFQTATPWINVKNGQVITDWTHLNEILQLAVNMVDPVTGKPIRIKWDWVLCMPFKTPTLQRIRTATDVRTGDGASTTMATYAPSPINWSWDLHDSPLAYQLLTATASTGGGGGGSAASAKETVFFGAKKAVRWRSYKPFTVTEAPPGNPFEFVQDIVIQVKAMEAGVAASAEPRAIFKSYNS